MSYKNPRWKYSTIPEYTALESIKGWKKCPVCKEFPRVWIFDNGCYAKCCCTYKFDKHQAEAESIMAVLQRTGSTKEYSRDNLRVAWNARVDIIKRGSNNEH